MSYVTFSLLKGTINIKTTWAKLKYLGRNMKKWRFPINDDHKHILTEDIHAYLAYCMNYRFSTAVTGLSMKMGLKVTLENWGYWLVINKRKVHSSLNIWIKEIVGLTWVLIAVTTLPMKVSLTVEIFQLWLKLWQKNKNEK